MNDSNTPAFPDHPSAKKPQRQAYQDRRCLVVQMALSVAFFNSLPYFGLIENSLGNLLVALG